MSLVSESLEQFNSATTGEESEALALFYALSCVVVGFIFMGFFKYISHQLDIHAHDTGDVDVNNNTEDVDGANSDVMTNYKSRTVHASGNDDEQDDTSDKDKGPEFAQRILIRNFPNQNQQI